VELTSTAKWNSAEGTFTVASIGNSAISLTVDSPFKGIQVSSLETIGGFFENSEHNESVVLTLRKEDSPPIGYLMRLSAAFSRDAGFDEIWFKRAAILTALWALQFSPASTLVSLAQQGGEVSIDQLFPVPISVLVLSKSEASSHGLKYINQLYPQLFALGFTPHLQTESTQLWMPGLHAQARLQSNGSSLKLHPIPRETRRFDFLSQAFSDFIPSTPLPLVRFFYYYQLIELLIDELSTDAVGDQLARLISYRDSGNLSTFRQGVQNLQKLFVESHLVKRLLQLPGVSIPEISSLEGCCNKWLTTLGHATTVSAAEGVYAIRHQLFHNFRYSGATLTNGLSEINALLEVVVPDLLKAVLVEKRHIDISREDQLATCDVLDSLALAHPRD
jgi:hypothetical protein